MVSKDSKNKYKIKLSSGRVLGPIGIRKIIKLVEKNQIVGREQARLHPDGDWQDINRIPELAQLLIAQLEGQLPEFETEQVKIEDEESVTDLQGTTVVVEEPLPGGGTRTVTRHVVQKQKEGDETEGDSDQTQVISESVQNPLDSSTEVTLQKGGQTRTGVTLAERSRAIVQRGSSLPGSLSSEETQMMSGFPGGGAAKKDAVKPEKKNLDLLKRAGLLIVLLAIAYELFFQEPKKTDPLDVGPIRPTLPRFVEGESSPEKSEEAYRKALEYYVLDNVIGYRKAAQLFLRAASLDTGNVKALSLLGSSYINLIDSSRKDESYFSTIGKIIDLAKAKSVDLAEAVIAEAEFLIVIGKPEAAEKRIAEFSRTHQFGPQLYYYLALCYFELRRFGDAARYLKQIPDDQAFSPMVFYLRGKVSENLDFLEDALRDYEKALKHPAGASHAKSMLAIAEIEDRRGTLTNAADRLKRLARNPFLLPPKLLGRVYRLRSKLQESRQNWDAAIREIQLALKYDPDNREYRLASYHFRAKGGEDIERFRDEARMFFFLGEGEKELIAGRFQAALDFFLQARQAQLKAVEPLIRIGDAFVRLNDLVNARKNYEAADRIRGSDLEILTRLIRVLIDSYEWDLVQRRMEELRAIPGAEGVLEQVSGDFYSKQGLCNQAVVFYQKAMASETVNPQIYIAYADCLLEMGNLKDAPFFYALARRFDPFNIEAIRGMARSLALTESADRAIQFLQKEMQNLGGPRAELLVEIARQLMDRGEYDKAGKRLDEASELNQSYGEPYKLRGEIHLARSEKKKSELKKALRAYQSYSDRDPSDPEGYLRRHEIFARQKNFNQSLEELDRVFGLFPKYPNLHFYRGKVYAEMGRSQDAARELDLELKNHPTNLEALIFTGQLYLDAQQTGRALGYFNRAMQLAPQNPEPKLLSGYANYLAKNYEGAIALYQAALQFDPGNPVIYRRLARAYEALGKTQEAREAMRQYQRMAQ